MSNWKKEAARDLIAFGSIPFYLIVLVRVLVGENLTPFYSLTYQFLIAAILILILSLLLKHSNNYASRSFALLVFTSLNYQDGTYTLFASALWLLLIMSLFYLKIKKADILRGVIVGLIGTSAAYYLVNAFLI